MLPILCRPASVRSRRRAARRSRGGRLADRRRARRERRAVRDVHAPAAFMGKRMVERCRRRDAGAWVSELPTAALTELPDALDGATFLDRWGATDDSLTTVEPDETYPVRAATTFGVEEHQRSGALVEALDRRCARRRRLAHGGQPGGLRRHGPRPPGGDRCRRRRRSPVPACTAHARAAAGAAARSSSCASAARSTTSTRSFARPPSPLHQVERGKSGSGHFGRGRRAVRPRLRCSAAPAR